MQKRKRHIDGEDTRMQTRHKALSVKCKKRKERDKVTHRKQGGPQGRLAHRKSLHLHVIAGECKQRVLRRLATTMHTNKSSDRQRERERERESTEKAHQLLCSSQRLLEPIQRGRRHVVFAFFRFFLPFEQRVIISV